MQVAKSLLSAALLLMLIVTGCASVSQRSEIKTEGDLIEWTNRTKTHPGDIEGWKNIGAYLFEEQKYSASAKYFLTAYKIDPADGETLYHLGRVLEEIGRAPKALLIYGRYQSVSAFSGYRKLMEARYRYLTRIKVREEMRHFMAQEDLIQATNPSPQTIAVFPLKLIGGESQAAAPLGKGISEMIMTDLSQIEGLVLVERIRVQALMDEINLGQTGLMDESTSPKFGKMLGAGKMVHGTFNMSGTNLNLDVTYMNVIQQNFSDPMTFSDRLKNMFLLEKDLVFKIIDEMNIMLTPEQRTRIQHVPTTNLQAFMAYCMGLEMEDRGQFQNAANYYKKATDLDPNFDMASAKAEENQMLLAAQDPQPPRQEAQQQRTRTGGGGIQQVDAGGLDRGPDDGITQTSLVNDRLETVSGNIGNAVIPSQDSRNPTEEAAISNSEPILEDLPLPPDLPNIRIP
ncbi:hypothetical protein HQ585_11725 [candidate division KSB1 bacterium]|nr:hypothetical protein [candidate division KSB1 bacterium]